MLSFRNLDSAYIYIFEASLYQIIKLHLMLLTLFFIIKLSIKSIGQFKHALLNNMLHIDNCVPSRVVL